jgi:hypothetical protein
LEEHVAVGSLEELAMIRIRDWAATSRRVTRKDFPTALIDQALGWLLKVS